jgi:hypothetical protein
MKLRICARESVDWEQIADIISSGKVVASCAHYQPNLSGHRGIEQSYRHKHEFGMAKMLRLPGMSSSLGGRWICAFRWLFKHRTVLINDGGTGTPAYAYAAWPQRPWRATRPSRLAIETLPVYRKLCGLVYHWR